MQPINDTKLEDLVIQANIELLGEMRKEGVEQIKRLFQKSFVLTREISDDENKLTKKKESLKNNEVILDKIKNGDWTALKKENKSTINNETNQE